MLVFLQIVDFSLIFFESRSSGVFLGFGLWGPFSGPGARQKLVRDVKLPLYYPAPSPPPFLPHRRSSSLVPPASAPVPPLAPALVLIPRSGRQDDEKQQNEHDTWEEQQ